MKIEFKKNAKISQQDTRRVPLQLQEAVEQEIDKLLAKGYIRRVENISDEVLIQPVVKKDKSVKVSSDASSSNNAIQKEKCQITIGTF